MRLIVGFTIGIVAFASNVAFAGKPSGGGGADRTPPAAIQDPFAAVAATRAITLRFVAPGDDGMAGRAAGYDVYYIEGVCASSGMPPGNGWVKAPRSGSTTAEISGSLDFFNVHAGDTNDSGNGDGLAPGTPHCIAIRARDEVPNPGPWRVVDATTLGTVGDWELSPRYRLTDGTRATAVHFGYLDAGGEQPAFGWVVTEPSGPNDRNRMQFRSALWQYDDVPAAPVFRIDNFRMIAIPDGTGRVGAVFGGHSSTWINYHQVVEIGPNGPVVDTAVWGAQDIGGIAPPGSGFTYVQRGDAWNPVVAFERIVGKTVAKGNVTWKTQLAVTERIDGQWQQANTSLVRTNTSAPEYFQGAQLFTKPDQTTLGLLVSQCDVLIYAERAANGTWTYWDAGPGPAQIPFDYVTDHATYAIGFSEGVGVDPAPIIARRTKYNGMVQITHPLTNPITVDPTSICASAGSHKPNAWEDVTMAPDPDLPYIGVAAVAEVDSNVFVALVAHHVSGKTADQRLAYRCAASPPTGWQVASIDRTNGNQPRAAFGPIVVNDRIQRAYDWNWPASDDLNPLALPDDFVVLASQTVSDLCP